jgi:hypothetical protein
MADFGGEMQFNVPSVGYIRLRGTFSVDPAGVTVSKITNQDNTNSRAFRPDGYGAELKSLEDRDDVAWDQIMRAGRQQMTIIEQQTGRIHIFGNAFFEGTPMVDRETGEVTGLRIAADTYRRANG